MRYVVDSADEVRRFAPLPRTVYLVSYSYSFASPRIFSIQTHPVFILIIRTYPSSYPPLPPPKRKISIMRIPHPPWYLDYDENPVTNYRGKGGITTWIYPDVFSWTTLVMH